MAQLEALIQSYVPMSEASFLLLNSLLKENHGYGIMQQVAILTDNRVNLGAGTVYTILYKMERDGLISVVEEQNRRKVYLITPVGRSVLQAEGARLCQLAQIFKQMENNNVYPALSAVD